MNPTASISSSTSGPYAYAGGGTPFGAPPRLTNAQKFQLFLDRHDLSNDLAKDLEQLEQWDIVFICDDSGSMGNLVDGGPQTRWDELRQTCETQIELASCFDEDGPDIYFLNRAPVRNLQTVDQVYAAFSSPPNGRTPLGKVLQDVLREKYAGHKLLIMIATDGVPSDISEKNFFKLVENRSLEKLSKQEIKTRQRNIRFGFLACTDRKEDVKYLDTIDKKAPGVDTVDDYSSERKQIKKARGEKAAAQFTREVWIAKGMLGPIDSKYDKKDEK